MHHFHNEEQDINITGFGSVLRLVPPIYQYVAVPQKIEQ